MCYIFFCEHTSFNFLYLKCFSNAFVLNWDFRLVGQTEKGFVRLLSFFKFSTAILWTNLSIFVHWLVRLIHTLLISYFAQIDFPWNKSLTFPNYLQVLLSHTTDFMFIRSYFWLKPCVSSLQAPITVLKNPTQICIHNT